MAYWRARPSALATSRDAPLSPPDFIRFVNAGRPMPRMTAIITITVSISISVNPFRRDVLIQRYQFLILSLLSFDGLGASPPASNCPSGPADQISTPLFTFTPGAAVIKGLPTVLA